MVNCGLQVRDQMEHVNSQLRVLRTSNRPAEADIGDEEEEGAGERRRGRGDASERLIPKKKRRKERR
jgi:hypothetical protein